jgi:hypothetical protein
MPVPSYGAKVWVQGCTQPNGYIVGKDYEAREVYVRCYDTDETVCLDFDDFDMFNERLNQWLIYRTVP